MSCFVGGKLMPYLFRTVFSYFAKRIATAFITFKKQGQETKHHYSKQRRLSSKGKPFAELVHSARLDVVWQIVILEVYKHNKTPPLLTRWSVRCCREMDSDTISAPCFPLSGVVSFQPCVVGIRLPDR